MAAKVVPLPNNPVADLLANLEEHWIEDLCWLTWSSYGFLRHLNGNIINLHRHSVP